MEAQTEEVPSSLPLMIPDDEKQIIDSVIMEMAAHVRRLAIQVSSPLKLNSDRAASCEMDEVIAAGFKKLRDGKRIDDIADKLLERIMQVGVGREDPGHTIGMIFIRLYDTMNYIVAWKGKFRGRPHETGIDKEVAREQLRQRKLL